MLFCQQIFRFLIPFVRRMFKLNCYVSVNYCSYRYHYLLLLLLLLLLYLLLLLSAALLLSLFRPLVMRIKRMITKILMHRVDAQTSSSNS